MGFHHQLFIWDAAKIDLPKWPKKLWHQSAYQRKVMEGRWIWKINGILKKLQLSTIQICGLNIPYPNAVNVAADIGGMEYPGLNFCGYQSKNKSLWGVTDHEFGHNWFPMIVGSNERLYAWMDEEGIQHLHQFLFFRRIEVRENLQMIWMKPEAYVGWLTSRK